MENKEKLTKKQKKEAYRIGRKSGKIMGLVEDTFQKDPNHAFSRVGLLEDRKLDYWPDDYELLARANDEKAQRAMEEISKDGVRATANALRNYCQILTDPNQSQEEGTKALLDAMHLLIILAKLGKGDAKQINKAIIDDRARDVSIKDLDEVMHRQWVARNIFYTPELRSQLMNDLKVRTIG